MTITRPSGTWSRREMTAIRYDVKPEDHLHGFPDGVLDTGKNAELKAFCEANLVDYGYQCDKTGKFVFNGITYYASAKTLKMVEKQFKIDRVFTDRDLEKERREQEDSRKKLMATDDWLENKVLDDCVALLGSYKQYAFVQKIRDENPEVAHARMTRVTQKYLRDGTWGTDRNSHVIAGPNFPKAKLPKDDAAAESRPALRRRSR